MNKNPTNLKELNQGAKQRSKQAITKVRKALKKLKKEGKKINFESVAKTARVAKSMLYANRQLREEIESLREQHLAQNQEGLLTEMSKLETENARLKILLNELVSPTNKSNY